MAARIVSRYMSRRFCSGKVLSEEEKAAENVYIKKMEKEKMEKMARQAHKHDEALKTASETSAHTGNPSGATTSTTGVSSDINRNYGVLAGFIAAAASLGWYLKSSSKKPAIQD